MASRSALRPVFATGMRSGTCAETRHAFGGCRQDQTSAAGHRPDVPREVLHLVADGRPVERPLMRFREQGRAVLDCTVCAKVKVLSIEIACRGPSANIQVTLSVKPFRWQL